MNLLFCAIQPICEDFLKINFCFLVRGNRFHSSWGGASYMGGVCSLTKGGGVNEVSLGLTNSYLHPKLWSPFHYSLYRGYTVILEKCDQWILPNKPTFSTFAVLMRRIGCWVLFTHIGIAHRVTWLIYCFISITHNMLFSFLNSSFL